MRKATSLLLLLLAVGTAQAQSVYDRYLDSLAVVREQIDAEQVLDTPVVVDQPAEPIVELAALPEPEPVPEIVVKKPNFWKFAGDLYLQAMQNYYSNNWYQGLTSNYAWLARFAVEANYNNKQKVTWDNKLEMNLGYQTTPTDLYHGKKTTEDLWRYTGKVGLQATKNWYYTAQLVANTQFAPSYEDNEPDAIADLLAPLNVNFSIGMSYNMSWCKDKLTGSIYLSPIASNYKYVNHKRFSETNGIDADKHSLLDYGSTITIDGTWKFNDIISWKTRFYYYTTYSRVDLQWENTLNVQVGKFIALSFYIYPRIDDSSTAYWDEDLGYLQFKEYTAFGLTYSF